MSSGKDEHFPLLVYLVEEEANRRACHRARTGGINSGVSAVLSRWPDHLAFGWLSSLIYCLLLVIFCVLLVSLSGGVAVSRRRRCVPAANFTNTTIHLVHGAHDWRSLELDNLKRIHDHFPLPNYTIRLVNVRPQNREPPPHLLAKVRRLRNVHAERRTYQELFAASPLVLAWTRLDEEGRVLAARALALWQYGGLSFDLGGDLGRFLDRTAFERLPPDGVALDGRAAHLWTRQPCHALFEEMVAAMRTAGANQTATSFVHAALHKLCHGPIHHDFCDAIKY